MKKPHIWRTVLLCAAVPAVSFLLMRLFGFNRYDIVLPIAAILSCVPFFMQFERSGQDVRVMVIIAVMTALATASRIAFYFWPSVKPVTAIVMITGLYFGGEAGFLTGAMTALLSNIYFGQGPYTPFQMFAWGLCGLLAGLLSRPLLKHFWLLLLSGGLLGFVFSALMDVWSALWIDEGAFHLSRYLLMISQSLPMTITYCVSNIVFLAVLSKPLGWMLTRIRIKFGMDSPAPGPDNPGTE